MRLRCGRAWVGTGYGFDPGTGGGTRLASVVPESAWLGLHGPERRSGRGNGPRQRPLPAADGDLQPRRAGCASVWRARGSRTLSGPPGSAGTFTHSCGESQFSLATGYAVDAADQVKFRLTHPEGLRAGRFRFRSAASDDVVSTFLVCLGRRSSFG